MCKKIPHCPNCNTQMVNIWYHEPDEMIDRFVKEKKVFWRGLEKKDVDRDSPERIIYHCYNCNRSYSKNLNTYIEEKEDQYPYDEINNLIDIIASQVISDLSDENIEFLKKHDEFEHFGIGLYIRNNYIYNNKNIKYRVEPDEFSHKIYNKIMEKLNNK